MKYIVYQTTCKINNKIYIGTHSTEDPGVFDGYLGCGVYIYRPATYNNPNTPFKCAVKKYGVKNFIRTIIKVFDDENEAYAFEAELVDEAFVAREDTYNLALGGRSTAIANDKKKVYMYTLEGEFEREFKSLREAALYLNPACHGPGHMTRAIKLGHQYLGHQFSYDRLPKMKKLKCRTMGKVAMPYIGAKVGRFDDSGQLLQVYESMTECVKDGYKNAKLVATGTREHCKGFRFKYLD